jgi:Na+-transporting NADH:ubiquinone oxidoreductase subunit B
MPGKERNEGVSPRPRPALGGGGTAMKDMLARGMDRLRPVFEEGGRFPALQPAFEAIDTFLFVPGHTTSGGTHIKDGIDLKRTMSVVVAAMLPCLLFGTWNTGHQHYAATGAMAGILDGFWAKLAYGAWIVAPLLAVSYGVGLGIEFLFAILRRHPVNEGYLVTGMLIPLILPPTIPLWMVALATAFAVIVGKEAFGGTGMNVLNVALVARVFLFFAYPARMAGDRVWVAGNPAEFVDGFTGATPLATAYLDGMKALTPGAGTGYDFWQLFWGTIPGSIGETSAAAILIGAAILAVTGIGSWRIMASVTAGALAAAVLFGAAGVTAFAGVPPHYHLVLGSMLFATVFMATDPVTAAQTEPGKVVYGFLIGVFGMIIRVLNPAYPEGWMLAILLMNVFAPAIDHVVLEANMRRRSRRALQ